MGLDTSHEAWHGAYSAFSRWREGLVTAAGYELNRDPITGHSDYGIPEWNDSLTQAEVEGEWKRTLNEPLVYLLWHSDCDGLLHPTQAALLADRLDEILPNLPEGEGGGHIGDWRAKTQKFIDGCRAAVAAGEPIEFY